MFTSFPATEKAHVITPISEYKRNYDPAELRFECLKCYPKPNQCSDSLEGYSTVESVIPPTEVYDKKPYMRDVIYNDNFAKLNPTRHSDYKTNYVKPTKEAYRVKRSQNFYQNHTEPSIAKVIKSEYKNNYK